MNIDRNPENFNLNLVKIEPDGRVLPGIVNVKAEVSDDFQSETILSSNLSSLIKKESPDNYEWGNIPIDNDSYENENLYLSPLDICKIKKEIDEEAKDKIISEECDIPTVKVELGDFLSQSTNNNKIEHVNRTKSSTILKHTRILKCPVCQKKFSSSISRKKHFEEHFRKRCVICSFCGKIFIAKKEFLRHFRNYLVKPKIKTIIPVLQTNSHQCTYCNSEFSTQKGLNIHLSNSHASEKPFQCHICLKRYTVLYTLKRHLPTHSNLKPYTCNICSKKFSMENLYKYHMLIHERGKQFKCNICSREFVQKNGLQIHQLVHKGVKFSCKICSKQYTRKVTLKSHMRLHSGERQFKCNICHKELMSRGGLKTHLMNHKGDKPFQCTFCSMRFLEKKKLKKHLQGHEKARVSCEICSIGFLYKTRLRDHLLTVHGEKPFKCSNCPEKFTTEAEMNKHLTTHVKVEVFSCEICLTQFNKRSSYIRHLGRHGKKPFECEICQEQYSSEKNIREHYFAQHPGAKPFKCNVCSRGFFHKRSYRKHICEKDDQTVQKQPSLLPPDCNKPITMSENNLNTILLQQ